jgi:hypothetical protein
MSGLGADEPSLAQQATRLVSSGLKQAVGTGGLIRSATLRSSISPDIDLDPRTAGGPSTGAPRRRGGFTEGLMAFVKPEIEVMTAAGPIHLAPWGRPRTNYFWPVVILGVAGTGALIMLAARGLRR